ncbi:MAG: hypothetical protein QOG85_1833 [Gaiellaceae bacterium]|jgi:uncharacterized protein YacL|nr:hypothetical protein [Gaiellaceae bacterium]
MTGLVLGVLAGLLIAMFISDLAIQHGNNAVPGFLEFVIVFVVAVIGMKAGGSTKDGEEWRSR